MIRAPAIPQAALGLDPSAHVPIPLPKQGTKGPTRYRMFADQAAAGDILALGESERDLAVHLLTNPRHRVVHDRPHELVHYVVGAAGGIERRVHVPAFGVLLRDGRAVAVDVGPDDGTGRAVVDTDVEAAYAALGVVYSVWTRTQVTVSPLLPNLKLMRRLHAPHDREAILALRGAINHDELPQTVGQVCSRVSLPTPGWLSDAGVEVNRAMCALVHLALQGEVFMDLSVPLGPATAVHASERALRGAVRWA